MSTAAKKDGTSYWIRAAIWLILSFAGWFLPPVGPVTAFGMKVIFIFVGLMFGWICLDLIYPSFMSIILVALASGEAAKTFFYAGFSSEIVVVIIVLTSFIAYANKVGLDNYIAQKFIRIRFLQGHPWLFVTAFMVLIYVLGLMIDIYPAIFLLWPVTYQICDEAGFEHAGKFSSYMCFAITFISGLGMLSKPFSPWSLIGVNALDTFMGDGFTINYSLFTLYMFLISMVIIACYLLIGKMMRLDLSPLKNYRVPEQKVVLTHEQKIGAVVFIAFFVMMYLPSLLPAEWTLTKFLDQMGVLGVGAILLIFLGVGRTNGKKLCQIDKLAQEAVPWQIVFLMVANAVMGSALENENAGIIAGIHAVFGPLVQGLSPVLFYIVLIVLYGIVTQFVHNVVLLAVFTPIALQFGTMVGANPVTITFIGIVILSTALATAGASSRSGLVFANTEWIAPKWAYYLGIMSVVLVMIAYAAIGVPLANLMFPV